jgi:ABC-type transport system substrate-binding protein
MEEAHEIAEKYCQPVFGLAEGTETTEAAETTETAEEVTEVLPPNLNYDYDELVVGATMPMLGAFSFGNWGNATSDASVRRLIHGYNLVEWDPEKGGFHLNPNVVSGELVEAEANGNHIYNMIIADDLFYSDGTQITAYDYAFSFLLRMSPVIAELGGNPTSLNYLVGYDDYISGAASMLTGIRVTGPSQMSINISAEYLPFFYEVGLLDCYPYPASLIAPGCEVRDDGQGIYLSEALNAEQLRTTLLDPETGYLSHPTVTSGAYKLVSYEGTEARFELNEYYKGNSDGVKPVIPRIVFRTADPDTMMAELGESKYGLLNKITLNKTIQEGNQLIVDTGRYTNFAYPRPGLSYIAFNTEHTGVADAAVRRAIAMCLDKEGLTTDYTGPYGLKVDGFYGIGQWMFQILNGTNAPEAPEGATDEEIEQMEKDWEEITLENVAAHDFDPEAAAQALEAEGWKLNADGIREKEVNGETVTLALKMAYPVTTPIAEILEARFATPLKEAGIALTIEAADNVLAMYYGQAERDYDLVWLASDFDVLFDPSPLFAPGSATNTTGIQDEELYNRTLDMRKTEPGDLLSYCRKWVSFLERFAEVEPMIPVYSNVYYDFYPDVLQDYAINSYITWSEAIVPAYLSDPPEAAEEEETDEGTEMLVP